MTSVSRTTGRAGVGLGAVLARPGRVAGPGEEDRGHDAGHHDDGPDRGSANRPAAPRGQLVRRARTAARGSTAAGADARTAATASTRRASPIDPGDGGAP